MKTTRRAFAGLAASAVAFPLVAPLAEAQTTAPPAAAPAPTPVEPLAQAMTAVVRAEYGAFLSEAELATIEKDMAGSARGIRRLREFPLTNADEPDCSFSALGRHHED